MPFYQPIIGRDRQVKGYEVLARRWEPRHQRYQEIDFPSLSDEESLRVDIVMLRAILRDLPTLAKGKSYMLSINLNPALGSATYQSFLLQVLLQARKLDIAIWFEVVEYTPLTAQGVSPDRGAAQPWCPYRLRRLWHPGV